MPISTTTRAVTAQKALVALNGDPSGCTHAKDFAVVDDIDTTKQVGFDLSTAPSGTKTLLNPVGITNSSIEIQLSFHSGTSTAETVQDNDTLAATVTMRLRKTGDVVFCSIDSFTLSSFAGTTGQQLKSQAVAIPTGYGPFDDNHSFLFVQTSPSVTVPAVWAPFQDRHIEYYTDPTYAGFTNGGAYNMPTVTAVWTTAALDA